MDEKLYSFVVDKNEIRHSLDLVNSDFARIFQACCDGTPLDDKTLAIESILDYLHDELNTGHWSQISIQLRRAFTAASFIKTIISIQNVKITSRDILQNCLKTIDMGLLLGAPLEINSDLLTSCATFLSQQLAVIEECPTTKTSGEKRKLESCQTSHNFRNVKGDFIETLSCPSLELFNKYFSSKTPVKLQDCVSHWPALKKWADVNYLLKTAGDRTVPIEIGSHYTDENWRQELMTLKEFIRSHFLQEAPNIGYLAQHNLFDQIPELRKDIYIPDYCCVSESEDAEDPDINAWLGPSGTVSPLHHDPKNNLLVQVFGSKQLILYSPKDSPFLYPHEGRLLSNTAQVDPLQPNLEEFPEFINAVSKKCILEPGEMLYIPPKWWHHVTALEKSFSVSFWWK